MMMEHITVYIVNWSDYWWAIVANLFIMAALAAAYLIYTHWPRRRLPRGPNITDMYRKNAESSAKAKQALNDAQANKVLKDEVE